MRDITMTRTIITKKPGRTHGYKTHRFVYYITSKTKSGKVLSDEFATNKKAATRIATLLKKHYKKSPNTPY